MDIDNINLLSLKIVDSRENTNILTQESARADE